MHQKWYRGHRSPAQKAERKNQILNYRNAFDDLRQILLTMEQKPNANYNEGDWALKMAHINGANKMLEEVLSIIDMTDKKAQTKE